MGRTVDGSILIVDGGRLSFTGSIQCEKRWSCRGDGGGYRSRQLALVLRKNLRAGTTHSIRHNYADLVGGGIQHGSRRAIEENARAREVGAHQAVAARLILREL